MEKNNKFKIFIAGLSLEKASMGEDKKDWIIEGIASTSKQDTDEEFLNPKGFDLSYFLNYGFINYNHQSKNDPNAYIGEPIEAKITSNNELFVKGKLWKESALAKKVVNLHNLLKKSNSKRKLGWSIEGKILKRNEVDERVVEKALITNVAITATPKNPGTWANLLKGEVFNEEYQYDIIENKHEANGGNISYILDVLTPKGDKIIIDKNFQIKIIGKALSTQNAGAIIKEDLEKNNNKIKFPEETIKSLILISEGYEKGLINKEDFEKIKMQIKTKLFKQ